MAGYLDLSVVAVGRFNPAIFQPGWFRTNEILPSSEVDAAENSGQRVLVTNDVTSIVFDSVRIDVQKERWSLGTTRQDWKKDLGPIAASIFKLLPHTPITTVGFNYAMHRFVVGGKEAADRILRKWVPVEDLASVVGKRVHIGGTVRCEWEEYLVTFILDSSVRLIDGIYIGQNFEQKVDGAKEFNERLESDWLKVVGKAEQLIATVCSGEEFSS